jgi:hypothetical protein
VRLGQRHLLDHQGLKVLPLALQRSDPASGELIGLDVRRSSKRVRRFDHSRAEEGQNRCSQHRFGPLSDWSEPLSLGPIINSSCLGRTPGYIAQWT